MSGPEASERVTYARVRIKALLTPEEVYAIYCALFKKRRYWAPFLLLDPERIFHQGERFGPLVQVTAGNWVYGFPVADSAEEAEAMDREMYGEALG
jgi:hypothetical protein